MGCFFNFTANTIDGQLLDVPQVIQMDCDLVQPLGLSVVRQFDKQMCIVARKVYLVFYGGHVFGTTAFENTTEFLDYRNANCADLCCYLKYNNCDIVFNGRRITI